MKKLYIKPIAEFEHLGEEFDLLSTSNKTGQQIGTLDENDVTGNVTLNGEDEDGALSKKNNNFFDIDY